MKRYGPVKRTRAADGVLYLPIRILLLVAALERADVRLLGGQLRRYPIFEVNSRQVILQKQGAVQL
jgi:hypothetical protein